MPGVGGTYTLLVDLPRGATIEVGALGERTFDAGWYAYVGSAFGPGGFARVERHRETAAGDRDTRHWHLDYLLGHPAAAAGLSVESPGVDAECTVAERLRKEFEPIPGVGCSDCGCSSHLFAAGDRDELRSGVKAVHESVR